MDNMYVHDFIAIQAKNKRHLIGFLFLLWRIFVFFRYFNQRPIVLHVTLFVSHVYYCFVLVWTISSYKNSIFPSMSSKKISSGNKNIALENNKKEHFHCHSFNVELYLYFIYCKCPNSRRFLSISSCLYHIFTWWFLFLGNFRKKKRISTWVNEYQ